jgi:queuine tRNA-ribosyltransferase
VTFEVVAQRGQGRRGRLHTAHGVVETPAFMPVGTLGSVKALDPHDLRAIGARICLANAYHLMLRPGDVRIRDAGGLHRFIGYDGALLCDSGGFQVYSLAALRTVTEEGVRFRSHIDGALHLLTPERLVEVQERLAPDVAMVLDECAPAQADRDTVVRAMDLTTRWTERALAARSKDDVAWFGIVQGALHEDLRAAHCDAICKLPCDGFAIGGVSVGESTDDIRRIVAFTAPRLPADKPRYLMGVGTPEDIRHAVQCGVDLFDCVMPSRNARNGTLFTSEGKLSIKNARFRTDDGPLDPRCDCSTCGQHSRAFLRHLFVCEELTYHRLATIHNLRHYLSLMERLRDDLARK